MTITEILTAAVVATQPQPVPMAQVDYCTVLASYAAAYVHNGQRGASIRAADRSIITYNLTLDDPLEEAQLFDLMIKARPFFGQTGEPMQMGLAAYWACMGGGS